MLRLRRLDLILPTQGILTVVFQTLCRLCRSLGNASCNTKKRRISDRFPCRSSDPAQNSRCSIYLLNKLYHRTPLRVISCLSPSNMRLHRVIIPNMDHIQWQNLGFFMHHSWRTVVVFPTSPSSGCFCIWHAWIILDGGDSSPIPS